MTGAPAALTIQLLGRLEVLADGRRLDLPASRKTRALLAYLVLTGAPQRRDRLCELFWDVPDDPRGALRWSLSKLRAALNHNGVIRLAADRERVSLSLDDLSVDLHDLRSLAEDPLAAAEALAQGWRDAGSGLVEDCDIANQASFSAWLESERQALTRLRADLARRLSALPDLKPEDALAWAERWLADRPFDPEAAHAVLDLTRRAQGSTAADQRTAELQAAFASAGIGWTDASTATPAEPPRPRQTVRFVQASDGADLAWASVGREDAPPLVKAANWLTHLELDWEAPIWSPLYRQLAQSHRLIRYDERGCGLSDWDVPEISFETFVTDLETVVDAAGLDRFPLLGISQGASVSIEYAVRHPERVSHLILFGGYPAGWRHTAADDEVREREAVMVLTEAGWGRADPAYRHLFSTTFLPDATPSELAWFDEFQRRTTSPRNAVRFLQAFSELDVRERLAQVTCPTLVIHSRGDRRIPLSTGRALASAIPEAEFIGLESNNHLLIGREPSAQAFIDAVRRFLS